MSELLAIELFLCIKMDLALNVLQWLICHKYQLIICVGMLNDLPWLKIASSDRS